MEPQRYAFAVEWFDSVAGLVRKYQLFFYPADTSIEMFDLKARKIFLKRAHQEALTLHDLYVGASVNYLSRQLNIVDYGDEYTRSSLIARQEKTLVIIKPDAVNKAGLILDTLLSYELNIVTMQMFKLSRQYASDFYAEHKGKPFFDKLIAFMTEGPVIVLEIIGVDAVQQVRKLVGPTDTLTARSQAPASLRARFGTDGTRNACHASDSMQSAQREIKFFFEDAARKHPTTALFKDTTLCIIKPHIINDKLTGKVLDAIIAGGFEVSALRMFHLDRANCEEFLEVYKGVVNEYGEMVAELLAGPCVALELKGANVQSEFRQYVGPADPEIAKHLRKHSLRAKFGVNKVYNAVHCTDLPEDGPLEVAYFFQILNS